MAQDKTVAEKIEKPAGDKAAEALRDNRLKALDLALAQIEKQFGKGSIMRMDGNVSSDIPGKGSSRIPMLRWWHSRARKRRRA